MGYVLEAGLDLPPLMLTQDEIEAAVLGAQWVANRTEYRWHDDPTDDPFAKLSGLAG